MDKEQIEAAIAKSKKISKRRNFRQTIDLIINIKGLDFRKQENQIDVFITLPHKRGKKVMVCALIGPELAEHAKETCDFAILADHFEEYRLKREARRIANAYDFFVAQASIMPKVAAVYGRVLGPRGKMPNPKSGCIVPPNANLKPLYEKLQHTVRITTKNSPVVQCAIGTEDMPDNEIAENALAVYKSLLPLLPNEKHNIKNAYIKLTMDKPVRIGEKLEAIKA